MVKISHLDERQLIEAVMDETCPDEAVRAHLTECPACRAQAEQLSGKLARFRQMTLECSPLPRKRPRLSRVESRAFGLRPGLRPAIGIGLAAASILALLLNPLSVKHGKVPSLDKVYQEMVQDAKFMSEIEKLEENPLPRFLVDISDPDGTAEEHDSKLPGSRDGRLS